MAKIKNGQTVSPNILNSSTVLLHVIMQKGYALKVTFLGWCVPQASKSACQCQND